MCLRVQWVQWVSLFFFFKLKKTAINRWVIVEWNAGQCVPLLESWWATVNEVDFSTFALCLYSVKSWGLTKPCANSGKWTWDNRILLFLLWRPCCSSCIPLLFVVYTPVVRRVYSQQNDRWPERKFKQKLHVWSTLRQRCRVREIIGKNKSLSQELIRFSH